MSIAPIQTACRLCARQMLFYPDTPQLDCVACSTTNFHPQPELLSSGSKPAGRASDALLRKANSYRTGCYFDKAEQLYTSFIAANPESPELHEAHWGLAMCRFGVEHVEDPVTKVILPTVRFTSPDSLQDDLDFKQAVELAPEDMREKYVETGRYVDQVQATIRQAYNTLQPYDIFLCYKHSDPGLPGHTTVDYNHAQDWYSELRSLGYNVFFANKTLQEYVGANYEAMIYHALNTAKVMLLFCSDPAYLDTPWVRSEWTRFIALSKKKNNKLIFPLLYGISPQALPVAISNSNKVQALNMMDSFAANNLIKSIKNHLGAVLPEVAPDLEEAASALLQGNWSQANDRLSIVRGRISREKQRSEFSDLCLYTLLHKLRLHTPEELQTCRVPFTSTQEWKQACEYASEDRRRFLDGLLPAREAIVSRALEDARQALEDKRWKDAAQALDVASGSIDAQKQRDDYAMLNVYRLMTHYQLSRGPALARCGKPVENTTEWKNAVAYASASLQETLRRWLIDLPTMLEKLGLTASFNADMTEATLGSCCAKDTSTGSLTLPEGVVTIDEDAFHDCVNLHHIRLPRSLRSIARGAIDCSRPGFTVELYDDTPLTENPFVSPTADSIRLIPTDTPTLMIREDLLLQDIGGGALAVVAAMSHKTKLTIPEGVTVIRSGAFSTLDAKASTSVLLPSSVTAIESSAFANNPRLKAIRLSDRLTTIGAYAFSNCTGLMEVRLPSSLTELGEAAFSGCSALTAAALSPKLARISSRAFVGCSALTHVDIPDTVPAISDGAFQSCSSLSKLRLPANLTGIGVAAFNGCVSLTEITLPKGVSALADSVFMGCRFLKRIDFTGTIITVAPNAFSGCTSLQRLSFPQGLLEIGDNAFQNCTALEKLTLPRSVHTFGRSVLAGINRAMPIYAPANSPAVKWGTDEGHPINPGGVNTPGAMLGHLILLPLRTALHLLLLLIPLFVAGYFLQEEAPVSDIIRVYNGKVPITMPHVRIQTNTSTGKLFTKSYYYNASGIFREFKYYPPTEDTPNYNADGEIESGVLAVLSYCWNDLLLPIYANPTNCLRDIIVLGVSGVAVIFLLCYLVSCLRFVFWRKTPKYRGVATYAR